MFSRVRVKGDTYESVFVGQVVKALSVCLCKCGALLPPSPAREDICATINGITLLKNFRIPQEIFHALGWIITPQLLTSFFHPWNLYLFGLARCKFIKKIRCDKVFINAMLRKLVFRVFHNLRLWIETLFRFKTKYDILYINLNVAFRKLRW